ncbi:uncharacterized protein LOC135200694 [Macrobrachium nipponense]|uniref:uncharacterized protein LOC135200694 n=1 Tax=Macrobrachium nipponense TaxID=159736 RepID=UPI0030C83406
MSLKRSFLWTPDHDQALKRVKQALSSLPVLPYFDPTLLTILQTDASCLYGIGYILLQDHGSGHLRVVQYGSHFLADAETRYATIELEMLAVSWALTKCCLYLKGLPTFTLKNDHRPLVPIINSYTLDMVENLRLQRMKEHMSQYQFTAVWRASKSLCITDALSRAPVSYPTFEDVTGCAEVTAHVRYVINATTASQDEDAPTIDADRTLQDMWIVAQAEPTYVRLCDCISSRFPTNRYDLYASLSPYWKLREALNTDSNLVLYGVAGKSFLVVTERLSGWPVVVPCKGNTTASSTIWDFCRYFREVRVPLRLHTDGGPQFTSKEFADFTERWGVHHITSSPHYPQSNGHAEAAVKHLILKTAPQETLTARISIVVSLS